jgi:alkylation response protein AidB-like acyl-CoA dehydrogenase
LEYFLTEQQREIKNLTRTIAEERVLPVRAALDEKEEFPWEIMKVLADAGLFGVFIPEEYNGLGGGIFELCLVVEELSRVCSGVAVSYAASGLGTITLLQYGSEEQKRKYLPDIAAGRRLAGFALTEEMAGSDPGGMKTTAQRTGDGYILNGTKRFITNGGEAEI